MNGRLDVFFPFRFLPCVASAKPGQVSRFLSCVIRPPSSIFPLVSLAQIRQYLQACNGDTPPDQEAL